MSWLPQAAEDLGCRDWPIRDGLQALLSEPALVAAAPDPVGLVVWQAAAPEPEAVCVRLLAVTPDKRRLGIGSRAVLAMERRLRRTAERIYVAVPSRLGLALYFWLRLGYRPLPKAEWPGSPGRPPAIWMARPPG